MNKSTLTPLQQQIAAEIKKLDLGYQYLASDYSYNTSMEKQYRGRATRNIRKAAVAISALLVKSAISKEQQEYIDSLTSAMTKQGNRATQYPFFYVYEKELIWTNDQSYDKKVLIDEDGEEREEVEDENGNIFAITFDDSTLAYTFTCEETGEVCNEEEGLDVFNLRIVYTKEVDKPVVDVGPFFTEAAAKKHIALNSYHYNKPFVYVNSAWRNQELQFILTLLFTLSGREIPSCYK